MPLRDHFHPPLSQRRRWEGVHNAWINAMVRQLSVRLPRGYFAEPQVTLGAQVEIDVATTEEQAEVEAHQSGNGAVATATWAPPRATRSCRFHLPGEDTFELRVIQPDRAQRLVAAVEVVSSSNKDRPESRRAFAVKCASYLQALVSVIVIDVVTERHHDLYQGLLELLGAEQVGPWPSNPPLYAVALRATKSQDQWRMETWEEPLAIGQSLPTLPLWLADNLAVPLELEATYEEACGYLRIT